jgi:hypothetical protein
VKIYVTKYALTQGIWAVEAEKAPSKRNYVRTVGQFPTYYYKGQWCPSRKSALDHAEQMRIKKIASLRKQIKKLENMTIEVHEKP